MVQSFIWILEVVTDVTYIETKPVLYCAVLVTSNKIATTPSIHGNVQDCCCALITYWDYYMLTAMNCIRFFSISWESASLAFLGILAFFSSSGTPVLS